MSQPYVHQTPNRIRVRSDFIQQHPSRVETLIGQLEQIPGIKQIQHRRYAGSVAIQFDSRAISAAALLETLESNGWMEQSERRDVVHHALHLGAKTLLKGIAVTALKRTLGSSLLSTVAAMAR